MGKASRWFRSLLSSKKPPAPAPETSSSEKKKKKKKGKWALSESGDNDGFGIENPPASPYLEGVDANKHAIAVAAATAAVAEAALAAAQAAAEVVRLTSGRNAASYGRGDRRKVAAAVKIQSAFRAYLARRALRALKGLVKLQAHVRGYIVRKQSADMLRRMQAMARIQAQASAHRSYVPESLDANPKVASSLHHSGVANQRNYYQRTNNAKHGGSALKQYNPRPHISHIASKESSHLSSNWLDHWMDQQCTSNARSIETSSSHGDDQRSDKILEIDTWKPRQVSRHRNDRTFPSAPRLPAGMEVGPGYSGMDSLSRLSARLQKPNPSISSEEVSSVRSPHGDQAWTAEISPRVRSASSNQRGAFTPARSEWSRSLFGDYIMGGHPNFMANTESSRAKVRSQSAPKQRLEEKLGRNLWESDVSSEKGFVVLPANYQRGNSYAFSGHMKRQGTPTRGGANAFGSQCGGRVL